MPKVGLALIGALTLAEISIDREAIQAAQYAQREALEGSAFWQRLVAGAGPAEREAQFAQLVHWMATLYPGFVLCGALVVVWFVLRLLSLAGVARWPVSMVVPLRALRLWDGYVWILIGALGILASGVAPPRSWAWNLLMLLVLFYTAQGLGMFEEIWLSLPWSLLGRVLAATSAVLLFLWMPLIFTLLGVMGVWFDPRMTMPPARGGHRDHDAP